VLVGESGCAIGGAELDDEPRAATRSILDPRVAAMQTRKLPHYEQADATAGDRRIRVDMNRLRDACVGCPTDMLRNRVGTPLPEHMPVMTVHISET